jgi:alanyl-tRNA synthetase
LTKNVGLDPRHLHVTVFAGDETLDITRDEQAIALWKALYAASGITAGAVAGPEVPAGDLAPLKPKEEARIWCYGATKNWWSRSGVPAQMPPGEPGGPDSEIFYDFGPELGLHENSTWKDQPCHPNCDCGRFLEIGNSVFMEYIKEASGNFALLGKPNVDYGGGLERLLMAVENCPDIFLTSAFWPLMEAISGLAGVSYQDAPAAKKRALRVIVDHLRSSVMLAADGVVPASKEQGSVLRRLIRRQLRFAHTLGITKPFLADLATPVIALYQDHYPEVKAKAATIRELLATEEKKFAATLEKGLHQIAKMDQINGQKAFFLYESYGFPFALTAEIAAERGQTFTEADFLAAQEAHRQESRTLSAGKFKGGLADATARTTAYHTATHLLLAALRALIDPHITQKGSNITSERARFDFNFSRPLTPPELTALEQQLNAWITADLPVTATTLPKDQALREVTVAVFADRYPDEVTVYRIGDLSTEICLGPHVTHTGTIGPLKITKEKGVSAGVRRLYLEIATPS